MERGPLPEEMGRCEELPLKYIKESEIIHLNVLF